VIPEAAVEAAARSLFENHPISKGHQAWDKKWGDGRIKTQFRADAHAALEAAAPHMLADLRKLVEDMEAQPWTEMGTVRGMAALIRSTKSGTL
jgi:hypothetical protein